MKTIALLLSLGGILPCIASAQAQPLEFGREMVSGSIGVILTSAGDYSIIIPGMPNGLPGELPPELRKAGIMVAVRTTDPLTTQFRITAQYIDSNRHPQFQVQTIDRDSLQAFTNALFWIPKDQVLSISVEEIKPEATFIQKSSESAFASRKADH